MSNDEKKERVVVDIRDLNKIVEFDSYFMSLQVDIISAVTESKFIFVIDVVVFFYQFRVRSNDRHKLTIVSHRKQEYFSVAFMSFKNSSAYAQRRIDIILRDLKYCCRAFIDDITIFSSTLEKHLRHLAVIFQRLLDYDIKLNSCKTFLNFSSIALLEQHVDELDLHAIKDKIAIILN
jgi:cleavage and polyadenylation specificity factor subunit 1